MGRSRTRRAQDDPFGFHLRRYTEGADAGQTVEQHYMNEFHRVTGR